MRKIAVLLLVPISPVMAAAAPLCALPAPTPMQPGIRLSAVDNSPAKPSPQPPASTPGPPLPAALANIPFATHVASSGATLIDLGASHGLHAIGARSGDQFMLFDVTPDGAAAVSGAPIELSVAQLQSIAAGNITELGVQHGLPGFFVRSGQQFQVFYGSPDQERVIPGVMWDASGKDLTRAQVARIPGAIPTVEVGSVAASGAAAAPSAPALPLVEKAAFGTIGPATAPHLFMLIDPQCVYSIHAFQMLRPFVESGRIQLSVIPLSVLDYEDHGQSTKSALALLSDPSDRLVAAWETGGVDNSPSADAAQRLRQNMAIATAIGLKGTPTFVWRKPDGSEGRIDGLPGSVEALIASVGS
jgi:thiol:disulfide interchange protein DsbG